MMRTALRLVRELCQTDLVVRYGYDFGDGQGGSIAQTATIHITGVNNAPAIVRRSARLPERIRKFTYRLLARASDPDATDVLNVNGLTLLSGDASGVTATATASRWIRTPTTTWQPVKPRLSSTATSSATVMAEAWQTATITITGLNVVWDGGAGTFDWQHPANWSNDRLPGPDDDVVIDVAEVITVSLSAPATVKASFVGKACSSPARSNWPSPQKLPFSRSKAEHSWVAAT